MLTRQYTNGSKVLIGPITNPVYIVKIKAVESGRVLLEIEDCVTGENSNGIHKKRDEIPLGNLGKIVVRKIQGAKADVGFDFPREIPVNEWGVAQSKIKSMQGHGPR